MNHIEEKTALEAALEATSTGSTEQTSCQSQTDLKMKFDLGGGFCAELINLQTRPLGDDVILRENGTWKLSHNGHFITNLSEDFSICQLPEEVFDLFESTILKWLQQTETDESKNIQFCQWLRSMLIVAPPWERSGNYYRDFSPYRHTFDDEGNANRFEDECEDWLIYDQASEQWFAWVNNHWEPAKEKLLKAARFVGRSVLYEEHLWIKEDNKKGFQVHAKSSANLAAQNAMLKFAIANMSVDLTKVSDLTLMACRNGMINRINGDFFHLYECDQFRNKYPTVYIDCEYHPKSNATEWKKHINLLMEDNLSSISAEERTLRKENLSRYLFRLFGYSLYPGNPERLFVFWWGQTSNGKSTTLTLLKKVYGNQQTTPALSQLYSADTDRPAPSIVDALPLTVAFLSEASGDKSATISRAAFKELTGETSTSKFRRMHQGNETHPILCLPIGITNDLPRFDGGVDEAILRRMVTIPFRHEFKVVDNTIDMRLLREKDEIFSMMVDELRNYRAEGLPELHPCALATQNELLMGHVIYEFVSVELEPTMDIPGEENRMTRSEIKNAFLQWVQMNEYEDEAGLKKCHDRDGGNYYELTKSVTTNLIEAMRLMNYPEVKIMGTRCFKVRRRASSQTKLKF